jgi:hypothetical protein
MNVDRVVVIVLFGALAVVAFFLVKKALDRFMKSDMAAAAAKSLESNNVDDDFDYAKDALSLDLRNLHPDD